MLNILILFLLVVGLIGSINGVSVTQSSETNYGSDGAILSIISLLVFTWPIYLISFIVFIVKSDSINKMKTEKANIISYLKQNDDSFDDNIVSDINYRKENISEKKDEYVKIDYEKKYTKVEFVRCPKCKSKVLKGSKFCMKCGEHMGRHIIWMLSIMRE